MIPEKVELELNNSDTTYFPPAYRLLQLLFRKGPPNGEKQETFRGGIFIPREGPNHNTTFLLEVEL